MNSFSSIHQKLFFFIIVLFGASLSQYYGSIVLVKGMSRSTTTDMELEKQLQSLNKTPIKSIQTENGIIIDCIDIYKQPAFDHPLLENHRIQMRPRLNPQVHNTPSTNNTNERRQEVVLQRMGCPKGSVPIRRTSKEDLIRAQAVTESYSANINAIDGPPSSNVAVVRTKSNTGQKFYGLEAHLNSQNPIVGAGQSSSSQFWIQKGSSVNFTSLQAGWIVSPSLYNDSKTHLFGFWRVDGPSSGGCFDILCTGFVQINNDYPIGTDLSGSSYYGKTPVYLKAGIFQHKSTGNWWLTILDDYVPIGYWPKELLPGLSDGSTDISFGGQTKGKNMAGQSPMMGNGHFPAGKDKFSYACYMSILKVYTASGTWEDPLDSILEEHTDNERCYGVDYYGYANPLYQRALQFGGPGGIC